MYCDFYGFAGRPFQLTPDAACYFESASHRQALSYLSYGLAQGEGFVLITGESGAGKSTLAAHLMVTIDRSRLTAAQVVVDAPDSEQLVQACARAFGLPANLRDGAALDAVERFLHEEARAGRRCLLVVDDAQNLSLAALEELRLLASFQLGTHPLLQVLLLGSPELLTRLQGHPELEQLRQRVIASDHLDPLEPGEVELYIHYRLRCAGWIDNPSFDPAIFAAIHAASGGVPRRINQIVSRLLLRGAVEQKRHIDDVTLARVLAELAGEGVLQAADQGAAAAKGTAEPHDADAPFFGLQAPAQRAILAPVAETRRDDGLTRPDARIAELRQAMRELAETGNGQAAHHRQDIAALKERLAGLENRVIEQERTIRHTLTMLIEWIERDDAHHVAA